MKQIVENAGFNRFSQENILEMERDILQTLEFKICMPNIFDEAVIKFKDIIHSYSTYKLP